MFWLIFLPKPFYKLSIHNIISPIEMGGGIAENSTNPKDFNVFSGNILCW